MKKKIIAATLAILCLLSFSACSNKGTVVMEYEDVYVNEEMYQYWLSHYKAVFMNYYAEIVDDDVFWNSTVSDGMTADEYFTQVANENIKMNIAAAWLFDYMGLSFTSAMKKEIKAGIDDICTNVFGGDEDEFDSYLAAIGMTQDDLYDVYVMDAKIEYAYEYLYGNSGVMSIPDSDKLVYTKDNYARIIHIYVNNNFKYVTVENELGTFTHDPETGEPYTEELTEDEKAEKNATIAAIDKALADGEDFADVWDEYSEDKLYSDGYYLQKDTNFITEVVDAAFELNEGESIRLETDYGVHYVMRLEIEGTPWDDKENTDFFGDFDADLADYIFTVMLGEITEKVTVDESVMSKYSIRSITPNSYI